MFGFWVIIEIDFECYDNMFYLVNFVVKCYSVEGCEYIIKIV